MSTDSKEEFESWFSGNWTGNANFELDDMGFYKDGFVWHVWLGYKHARNVCQTEIDALRELNFSLMETNGIRKLQEENAALKAENELNLAANRGLGRLVDGLQAENERLRKDAERLDALAEPGISLQRNEDPEPDEGDLFAVFRVTGYPNDREWTELGRGGSVREAIDAAMRESINGIGK